VEASERTDLAHAVAVNLLLGHSLHYTGDYREAVVVLRRKVEVLVADRVRERSASRSFPPSPRSPPASPTLSQRLRRRRGALRHPFQFDLSATL
jgi:hypothetical protein